MNDLDRRHAKTYPDTMAGATIPMRKCHVCGKSGTLEGGKYVRGTSRHNPGKFYCADCAKGVK